MAPASMITVVRGNAAELTTLLKYVASRVRPNSRIFMYVTKAVQDAHEKGTAEADETNFNRSDIMTLYEAWAALGHGKFVPIWTPRKKTLVRSK